MNTNNFKIFKVNNNFAQKRIDRVLRAIFPKVPLSKIYQSLRTKKILLNNRKVKENTHVQENDEIKIFLSDQWHIKKESPSKQLELLKKSNFYKKSLKILWEDEDLLVLDKPSGIPVHPGTNHYQGKTMIDLASAYLQKAEFLPKLVHRLDIDTSGALLFAKNNLSLQNLNQQMREKQCTKKYYALVNGIYKKEQGTIRTKLERTNSKNKSTKIIIAKSNSKAKLAITHFKVEKKYQEQVSLMSVSLETGRMHQIRVHFKSQDHPLIGDDRYGDFSLNRQFKKQFDLKRIFLHAYFLSFSHPKNKKKIIIKSPLPPDLTQLLEKFTLQ